MSCRLIQCDLRITGQAMNESVGLNTPRCLQWMLHLPVGHACAVYQFVINADQIMRIPRDMKI